MGSRRDQRRQTYSHILEVYFLLILWLQKLGPFFPALVPLQSLNLRAAIFRCVNELKKNGTLGKDVIVRKTFFDDCKGERIQELLVSFSTLVLRKFLSAGHGGRTCIAARLATAKTITAKEHQSFLPLAVAHRASLTAIIHKKRDLRERYKDLGRVLDAKEKELDHRFEAVISTQDFLDKNPIPDHTVARVSKLFETNWQGDHKPVEIIMQGEEQGMKDAFLDRRFSETWQQVSAGTFDGATGTSWQGLLQDLEERVASQESRLTNWRNFKEAMQRDESVLAPAKSHPSRLVQNQSKDIDDQKHKDFVSSPRKSPKKSDWRVEKEASPTHPKRSRKETTQDELKVRDLVFSPRKSPRKSMWPIENPEVATSPIDSQAALEQKNAETLATQNGSLDGIPERLVRGQSFEIQEGDAAKLSTRVPSVDDTDGSGFSDISDRQLHLDKAQDPTTCMGHSNPTQHSDQDENLSAISHEKDKLRKSDHRFSDISTPDSNPATPDDDESWISSLPLEGHQEENRTDSHSSDEEAKLAEQIISMTIDAAPTPAKSKASLMERTRQSMAFASPTRLQNLLPEGPSSSTRLPPISSSKQPCPTTTDSNHPTTLLDRTRRSISLVPNKKPRKSTLERRKSKIYPTNQFETPKKQQLDKISELRTPPDELFSSGAGYDSVFKSRPKIALSPNPSPSPKYREYFETDDAQSSSGLENGQREESPLVRMTAKV